MPEGGLCNMLRVVFSWYMKAKKERRQLIVSWVLSNACNGFFLDYFEPVPDIKFLKGYSPNIKYDYQGCMVLEEYNNPNMYSMLKPRAEIKARIEKNIMELKSSNAGFIAIHIRRTDHINHAIQNNKYTTDNDFYEFLDKQPLSANIYIATDNLDTQKQFKARYGDRIKALKWITPQRTLRQTSIEDAVVDIFTCVGANAFLGSGWSSFTDLINDLRVICN